jgi:acetyl-CoA carboxylase biotin carboxyl carrier protein
LNLKELKEILQILDGHDVAELEIEEEGIKLRIRKALPSASAPGATLSVAAKEDGVPASPPPTASAPVASVVPAEAPSAAPPPSPSAVQGGDLVVVKSPIVGTFFRAPEPTAPPFVNVGDRVGVGQILCIIEAMKLMNEIEAEVAGEITRIHTENGQPVQFGDPLFSLRPDR